MTGAGFAIRPAVAADASAVTEIVHVAYAHYIARIGKPPGPMLDDYDRRIADAQVWLLQADATVIGVLVLEAAPHRLLLDNIAVSPSWQGKGCGRRLIAFAEAEALRRGYLMIELYTHALMTENIALYQRLGFRETHRVHEKGYDRVYMTKRLQAT